MQANVHGGEESGTEASLRLLYELADRTDCVSETILDNAIVVILPVQNPDGREADTRRNAYDIDMNRDWFARTQPETDAKLELYRQLPPVLDLDVHEMGAFTYFFPPNSDPVYHEIADISNDWINGIYAPALAAEFDRQHIRYFNYEPYDFFGTFYGDTVPTVAFHAAGMTFEKESGDPLPVRMYEQYVTSIVSVFAAASDKDAILEDWHASWVEAFEEGAAGTLEPNEVFQRGHRVLEEAPTGAVVRHYFLRDDASKAYEVQRLIRRLQRMDVELYRLTEPLTVPDFRAYGRAPASTVLPAGTYWIPMAQARKHWVQSMLNEDTYIPHDVTYDVTGWSNPLLMNVPGGFTASDLDPVGEAVDPLNEPAWPFDTTGAPSVALFEGPGTTALESRGAVRWLFTEVWDLPFETITAEDVVGGALADHDVLVMPDGYPNYALQALGAKGKKALVAWVNAGGRLIAWEGSAEVATRIGASTAVLQMSHTNMPGSLVRIAMDETGPLAEGVGPFAWAMFEDDPVMAPGDGTEAAVFPDASSEDFFVSGLDSGADAAGRDVGGRRRGGRAGPGDDLHVRPGVPRVDGRDAADPLERDHRSGSVPRDRPAGRIAGTGGRGAGCPRGGPAPAAGGGAVPAHGLAGRRSRHDEGADVARGLLGPNARARRRAVPDREPAGALRRGASVRVEAPRGARGSGRRRAIAQPAVNPRAGRAPSAPAPPEAPFSPVRPYADV